MSTDKDWQDLLSRRLDIVIAMIASGQLKLPANSIEEALHVADDVIAQAVGAVPDQPTRRYAPSKDAFESFRRKPIALRPDDAPPLTEEEIEDPKNWIAGDVPSWNEDSPAVDREASFNGLEIRCLECGKSCKNLKTHLTMSHRMEGDLYKARWGLAAEFPMEHPSKHAWRVDSAKHLEEARASGQAKSRDPEKDGPAVPVEDSINDDYIICLEDGKKLKTLKRHLITTYGMTPEQYRAKWGLSSDYPMTAPNYAKARDRQAR